MSQAEELLLDLDTPLPAFGADGVGRWAAGRRVFISSTMRDLQPERQRVAATITAVGAEPRFFEAFSDSADPANVYVPEIRRADIVVLVLGERYGPPLAAMDGRSATHVEYDAAMSAFKPILIYRKEAEGLTREPQLESFLRDLEARHVVARFHDLDELGRLVTEGLTKRAQADSIEWVKLGRAVFPATSVWREGANVRIVTETRDPQIIVYLQTLSKRFGPGAVLIVGTDVLPTPRISVQEESRGRFQREMIIDIETQREQFGQSRPFPRHHLTQFGSYNGVPGRDLVEAYVRAMLFDEPMPDATSTWRGQEGTERPPFHLPELYAQLRDHQRVDELFPALGRLYLIDRLVRGHGGGAGPEGGVTDDVRRVEVSPVYGGQTHVHLEYAVSSSYSTDSVVQTVEGVIVLESPRDRRPITDWG